MFVTDAILLQALSDRLKLDGIADLPEYYASTIVPDANLAAYQEIVGRLVARGYTKAQIDSWDRGVEFQKAIGLYFAILNGGIYRGYDDNTLKMMDRREELDAIVLTASGVWVKPSGDQPGLVVTSGPSVTGGVFNYPDPDDPNLGEYTIW